MTRSYATGACGKRVAPVIVPRHDSPPLYYALLSRPRTTFHALTTLDAFLLSDSIVLCLPPFTVSVALVSSFSSIRIVLVKRTRLFILFCVYPSLFGEQRAVLFWVMRSHRGFRQSKAQRLSAALADLTQVVLALFCASGRSPFEDR